jgi:hypothetical protein
LLELGLQLSEDRLELLFLLLGRILRIAGRVEILILRVQLCLLVQRRDEDMVDVLVLEIV